MSLSDKIQWEQVIGITDVKEFIKELDEVMAIKSMDIRLRLLKKLAGEKLT